MATALHHGTDRMEKEQWKAEHRFDRFGENEMKSPFRLLHKAETVDTQSWRRDGKGKGIEIQKDERLSF